MNMPPSGLVQLGPAGNQVCSASSMTWH